MAAFLYFIPVDAKTLAPGGRVAHEVLASFYLSRSLGDCRVVPDNLVVTPTACGPDGAAGVVVVPQPTNPNGKIPQLPTFAAESAGQTWRRVDGGKGVWVGWQTDDEPGPDDLERDDALSGYRKRDPFGRLWLIPVVRGLLNQHGYLPTDVSWRLDASEPTFVLRDAFADLWNRSAQVWDHLFRDDYRLPLGDVCRFVLDAWSINYRVGPIEADTFRAMGKPLFDTRDVNDWAGLACDAPFVIETALAEKKSIATVAYGGRRLPVGEPAGSQDSSPVAAS